MWLQSEIGEAMSNFYVRSQVGVRSPRGCGTHGLQSRIERWCWVTTQTVTNDGVNNYRRKMRNCWTVLFISMCWGRQPASCCSFSICDCSFSHCHRKHWLIYHKRWLCSRHADSPSTERNRKEGHILILSERSPSCKRLYQKKSVIRWARQSWQTLC